MHADCRNTPGFWATVPLYGFHGKDYQLWLPGYFWCKPTNAFTVAQEVEIDPLSLSLHNFYAEVCNRGFTNDFQMARREREVIFQHVSKDIFAGHLDQMTNLALQILNDIKEIPGILSPQATLPSAAYRAANSVFRRYFDGLNRILGTVLCREVLKFDHAELPDWLLPVKEPTP